MRYKYASLYAWLCVSSWRRMDTEVAPGLDDLSRECVQCAIDDYRAYCSQKPKAVFSCTFLAAGFVA